MKTKRGRGVDMRIHVMRPVKSPQKRPAVVKPVPPVIQRVKNDKSGRNLPNTPEADEADKTPASFFDEMQPKKQRGHHKNAGQDRIKNTESQMESQAFGPRRLPPPFRPETFANKHHTQNAEKHEEPDLV